MDQCQTPPWAIEPLIPYLNPKWTLWESAAGEGLMANAFRERGFKVVATDILSGRNFFMGIPPEGVDAQVTNPPYGVKYEWIDYSYYLELPFALGRRLRGQARPAGRRLQGQAKCYCGLSAARIGKARLTRGADHVRIPPAALVGLR